MRATPQLWSLIQLTNIREVNYGVDFAANFIIVDIYHRELHYRHTMPVWRRSVCTSIHDGADWITGYVWRCLRVSPGPASSHSTQWRARTHRMCLLITPGAARPIYYLSCNAAAGYVSRHCNQDGLLGKVCTEHSQHDIVDMSKWESEVKSVKVRSTSWLFSLWCQSSPQLMKSAKTLRISYVYLTTHEQDSLALPFLSMRWNFVGDGRKVLIHDQNQLS